MTIISVFFFERLLGVLLHARGEEVTPSSDTAVAAEWKTLARREKISSLPAGRMQ